MKINPAKILILGTSDKMAQRIADRLKLPEPSRFIHIEDVAKPEEIEQAREEKKKKSKLFSMLGLFFGTGVALLIC